MKNLHCKNCNKPFEAKNNKQSHCSSDCAYQTVYNRALDAYYSKRVLLTEKRACKICSELFDWEGRRHKTNVCSAECRAKNDSRNNCRYARNRMERMSAEQKQEFAAQRRKYMRVWRAKRSEGVEYF